MSVVELLVESPSTGLVKPSATLVGLDFYPYDSFVLLLRSIQVKCWGRTHLGDYNLRGICCGWCCQGKTGNTHFLFLSLLFFFWRKKRLSEHFADPWNWLQLTFYVVSFVLFSFWILFFSCCLLSSCFTLTTCQKSRTLDSTSTTMSLKNVTVVLSRLFLFSDNKKRVCLPPVWSRRLLSSCL